MMDFWTALCKVLAAAIELLLVIYTQSTKKPKPALPDHWHRVHRYVLRRSKGAKKGKKPHR